MVKASDFSDIITSLPKLLTNLGDLMKADWFIYALSMIIILVVFFTILAKVGEAEHG